MESIPYERMRRKPQRTCATARPGGSRRAMHLGPLEKIQCAIRFSYWSIVVLFVGNAMATNWGAELDVSGPSFPWLDPAPKFGSP
jgi:hypothetical protein